MKSFSTPTWGYKILSENQINFYHVLLPKVNVEAISRLLPSINHIQRRDDGSITLSLQEPHQLLTVVDSLRDFFAQKEQGFLDTPIYHYKIPRSTRQLLQGWGLSFEGCLAILLMHNPKIKSYFDANWQFINSQVGGLFISPYTIHLNIDHPKVLHPITVQNYEERKTIEQTIARTIRNMIKNITEAQPNLEGLALLSLVEEKTKLSQKEIRRIINEKSFGVKTPIYCPFFTG